MRVNLLFLSLAASGLVTAAPRPLHLQHAVVHIDDVPDSPKTTSTMGTGANAVVPASSTGTATGSVAIASTDSTGTAVHPRIGLIGWIHHLNMPKSDKALWVRA